MLGPAPAAGPLEIIDDEDPNVIVELQRVVLMLALTVPFSRRVLLALRVLKSLMPRVLKEEKVEFTVVKVTPASRIKAPPLLTFTTFKR